MMAKNIEVLGWVIDTNPIANALVLVTSTLAE